MKHDSPVLKQFFLPTRIVAGSSYLAGPAALPDSMGKRAFLITGRQGALQSGALADVVAALDRQGISHRCFSAIEPNPRLHSIQEAATQASTFGATCIVGIGGGSALDACKLIALLAANKLENAALEASIAQIPASAVLPIVAIPTTAGTGSEVTPYAIITDDSQQTKRSISHPGFFPALAILNPNYTKSLSYRTTVYTALDALTHALEGSLSVRSDKFTHALAFQAISLIVPQLRLLANLPATAAIPLLDEAGRSDLLTGSCIAGMVIAQSGTMLAHALGYSLTYFKDYDHGLATALFMPTVLAESQKAVPELVAALLAAGGFSTLEAFSKLIHQLTGPMPALSPREQQDYVALALKARSAANAPFPTTPEVMAVILPEAGINEHFA